MVAAMALQDTANRLLDAAGHHIARKGVFRFRSHQEADAWARKMMSPAKPR